MDHMGQHDGQRLRPPGPYSIQTTRIQFEHLSVEKDNGANRFILSTRRDLTLNCQMCEEL